MAAYEAAGETDEWYTPRYIFDALGERFDLDVAAPNDGPRHVPTAGWLSSDALEQPWHGFVWMNPPFGHHISRDALRFLEPNARDGIKNKTHTSQLASNKNL